MVEVKKILCFGTKLHQHKEQVIGGAGQGALDGMTV